MSEDANVKIRVAVQGRWRTYEGIPAARFLLALEPPAWHRPSAGGVFITREYQPVSFDATTDTWRCVGVAEYWQRPKGLPRQRRLP